VTPSLDREGVTIANARQWLLDKLASIASRLKASAHLVDEPSPQIRPHTQDRAVAADTARPPASAAPIKKPEPEPPPDQLISGMIFGTISTSERIADSEFHTSVQSPTTQNWRRSIEQAERPEARKRGRFIG
jgi:hypothetical protein